MTRYRGRHRGRPERTGHAPTHRRVPSVTARVARAGLPTAAAVAAAAALGSLGPAPAGTGGQPPLTPQAATQNLGGHLGFPATPAVAALDVKVPLGQVAIRPPATVGATLPTPAVGAPVGALPDIPAIPTRVLAAYVAAARRQAGLTPGCHLTWDVLAGIGFVESGHAHSGGSDRPGWNGVANPPILGPVLDGTHGTAAVPDTDHGLLDGDTRWDRAVGPMQFIPSTWARYGVAMHHAGAPDPENIDDASAAAASYLCAASSGLDEPAGLVRAVYAYNHSFDYVRLVLSVAAHYRGVDPAALGVDGLPHDPVSPSPTPTPTASPSPSPSPARVPLPTRTYPLVPTAQPTPPQTARPVATAGPSASGSPSPRPDATPTASSSPSPAPAPSGQAAPSSSATPSSSPSAAR